ncbi:MAG: metallophosphoesterase [archaeon]
MRIAIISDTHTIDSIEYIYEYIRQLVLRVNIDCFVINGDILGINEIKKDYGYNYDRKEFYASLNKKEILAKASPLNYEKLILLSPKLTDLRYEEDEGHPVLEEFGKIVCDYITERYSYAANILKKFSEVKKTFFNLGNYESPIHYALIKELSFLLDSDEALIKKSILYAHAPDLYMQFKEKLQGLEGKNFRYIGGKTAIEKDVLFAGIPGVNESSVPTDSASTLQENITKELIGAIKRQLSYANKLILFNHTEGRITKSPFTFRPGSASVREFIQEMKNNKIRQKVFVQSHYHWITTHFYTMDDFFFVLNNSGVNNCIFNILELSNKIKCFDVDPKNNLIRELKTYDSYISDYSKPESRLSLNYDNPGEIIAQRNLNNCYYM